MPSDSTVWVLVYMLTVNLAGFILMGLDKKKAEEHRWRISEKTLFLTASIGGSIGVLLGMSIFRHKIKHRKFTLGIPFILSGQILLFVLFLRGLS